MTLWARENRSIWLGRKILHFAPEPAVSAIFKADASKYTTADIQNGRADLSINIEKIDLPDSCYDLVICLHVLEHVDDRAALAELSRVLTPGGHAILMFPVIEGWDVTYENADVTSPSERAIHFGQFDHVRYFGRDVRQRIADQGFSLSEYSVEGDVAAAYGITPGERVFIARKPD